MAPTWRHVCYWPLADVASPRLRMFALEVTRSRLAQSDIRQRGRTGQLTVRWVADAVPRRLLNAFVRPYVSSAPFVASSPASTRSPAWVEKEAQGLCF
jgi:hypothetical protein